MRTTAVIAAVSVLRAFRPTISNSGLEGNGYSDWLRSKGIDTDEQEASAMKQVREASILCAAMAVVATMAVAADNPEFSANYVLPGCRDALARHEKDTGGGFGGLNGMCIGAIWSAAVIGQANMLGSRNRHEHPDWLCIDVPEKASGEQLIRIVVRYADAHPELTHQNFTLFAFDALADAWPCGF